MKTIKQLLRQPLRTMAGILIVALAVAILVASVGQYAATMLTIANLDERYDTVGLISDEYFWESKPGGGRYQYTVLPEKYQKWINETVQTRPDLVKLESYSEVYSAYIPGLSPDNFSQYEEGDWIDFMMPDIGCGNPYRCAVLEVTLTQVGTIWDEDVVYYSEKEDFSDETAYRKNITLLCAARVECAIGLEQGFASPVGKTIALSIKVFDEADLEALELEAGQRYLVYGMDYNDVHGERMESTIDANAAQFEELFGPGNYDGLNDRTDWAPVMEQVHATMSVCNRVSMPVLYRDKGQWVFRDDLLEYHYRDEEGFCLTYRPTEEVYPDYEVPTITRLEGSAEAFLATEAGALWNRALEGLAISNHGFPVLAVDKLGYQSTFARRQARIVEGRDFTEAERIGSARVCIISQQVAVLNGLQVGDTIDMLTYAYDLNIEVQEGDISGGSRFPSAAVYSHAMGFTSEMETYTIVGIYRQNDAWQNRDDAYGITPNVIFVPKGSITGDKLTGASGIYYTLILQNGKLEEFRALQEEAGYPDLLICYDQGYVDMVAGLDAYEGVSRQALQTGLWAYGAVMLLFVLLFPLRQRAVLATMGSLGATPWRKLCHLMVGSIGLLIPGTVLGAILGILAWEQVAAELMASLSVSIPLEADMAVTAPAVAVVQLLAAMLVIFVLSIFASGRKNMRHRK